jgi:hypothetical protein
MLRRGGVEKIDGSLGSGAAPYLGSGKYVIIPRKHLYETLPLESQSLRLKTGTNLAL